MAISIQQHTIDTILVGLAAALTEIGIFDSVTVESGTLTAEKGNVTLFTFSTPASPTFAWYNKAGTQIISGNAASTALYTVSVCGKSVMMTFATPYTYTFVFGETKEGSVYMGYTFDHKNELTGGQLISLCENTTTMYAGAFQTGTSNLWSRMTPVCVQSNVNTVETTVGIYGFVERYTGVPATSAADITPKQFTMGGVTYLTDGSFVLEDA